MRTSRGIAKALLQQLQKRQLNRGQGFTLVELMVVVVIVGILSATALPQFLGVKDKAKTNTQLGEAAGLAKECSAAILTEGPYPANYDFPKNTTNTGLLVGGNCNGGNNTTPPKASITYTTEAATASSAGLRCGTSDMAAGKKCKVTVDQTTGQITYSLA